MKDKLIIITLEDKSEECDVEECTGGCNVPNITICRDCLCMECVKHECVPALPVGWKYKE